MTYIVQRMTSMAGMFYIMAMYGYLRGRTETNLRVLPWVFAAVCGGLAFVTKESAVMLPVCILLYDFLLVQGLSGKAPGEILRKNLKLIAALLFFTVLILTITHLYYGTLLDYSPWTFTLQERLLTEPRVLLFYITLLLYPASSRLMMDHDIELSRSLLHPPATLLAILALAAIVGYALYASRKSPLLSFCILFFFLNHLIEGSILPLDIAFEHRNYVPSLFFFVPVAVVMVGVFGYVAGRKPLLFIMALGTSLLLAWQAHTVFARNEMLSHPKLLWSDNVAKAPRLSRPHAILGALLYAEGNYRESRRETAKALELANYPNVTQPAIYYTNLGLADYLLSRDEVENPLAHFRRGEMGRGPRAHPDDVDGVEQPVERGVRFAAVVARDLGGALGVVVEGRGEPRVDEVGVGELLQRDRVHGADVAAADQTDPDHLLSRTSSFGSTSVAGPTDRVPNRSRTSSTARSTAARRSVRCVLLALRVAGEIEHRLRRRPRRRAATATRRGAARRARRRTRRAARAPRRARRC